MSERLHARMASASSWNPEARTAQVVLSTDADVGDGLRLEHTRKAIRWPERPISAVLDHVEKVDQVAGAVVDLQLQPLGGGTALVGTLQLDGPAADRAEPLLRTGAARWSIGARIYQLKRDPGSGLEVATDWSPVHLALVVAGQDPAAITRSAQNQTETETMTSNTDNTATDVADETIAERSAKQVRLERDLLRMAAAAGPLTEAETMQLLACRTVADGGVLATRFARERSEAAAPVVAGGLPMAARSEGNGLEETIYRALAGKESLPVPLWRMVVGSGMADGRAPAEIIRRALFPDRGGYVNRALSTSDLPSLLTAAGDRALMERFVMAPAGVMALAQVRSLADFRPATVIDLGTVGNAQKEFEDSEVKYGSVTEAANSYRAFRYSLGLKFTAESIANDDLSGLEQAIAEMGDACLSAEADSLVQLLEGTANGANAPDGLALFAAGHANSTTASGVSVATFSEAVTRLRLMKSIGGRPITQAPAIVVCAPSMESALRNLLYGDWSPTTSAEAMPWRGVELQVEPRLGGSYYYVASDSARRPLQLGRQTAGPVMTSETDFDTDTFKVKAVHAFGGVVAEHRSIVRVPAGS